MLSTTECSHFFAKTANVLDATVCANGDSANSRYSVVTLNGGGASASVTAGSTGSSSSTRYGACNRLVFLGNIYSRTGDQVVKVTEC